MGRGTICFLSPTSFVKTSNIYGDGLLPEA